MRLNRWFKVLLFRHKVSVRGTFGRIHPTVKHAIYHESDSPVIPDIGKTAPIGSSTDDETVQDGYPFHGTEVMLGV
jgi:hypothetical protein